YSGSHSYAIHPMNDPKGFLILTLNDTADLSGRASQAQAQGQTHMNKKLKATLTNQYKNYYIFLLNPLKFSLLVLGLL
ncbi:MAG: hypothetical protein QNJ60_15890, partial [Xenococcaceae cyanobacterium MO_188.B19]|nr:hypothetical protein [Xenococcaceae cyanobacterium MO_188.B19]